MTLRPDAPSSSSWEHSPPSAVATVSTLVSPVPGDVCTPSTVLGQEMCLLDRDTERWWTGIADLGRSLEIFNPVSWDASWNKTETMCLGMAVPRIQNYHFLRQFTPFRNMWNQQKVIPKAEPKSAPLALILPSRLCRINLTSLLHDSPLYLRRQQFCTLSSRINIPSSSSSSLYKHGFKFSLHPDHLSLNELQF